MGAPAAVLWDADGVLQTVPRGWEHTMRPVVEGHVEDVETFLAEAFEAERPALRGETTWESQLTVLLERWSVPHLHRRAMEVWFAIHPVPQTWDVVREVRARGVACHLASNQADTRAQHMTTHVGYDDLLERRFYSHELGVAKPDPAFFTTILDRLALEPGEVLFVDDNPANTGAAHALGIRSLRWDERQDVALLRDWLRDQGALAR